MCNELLATFLMFERVCRNVKNALKAFAFICLRILNGSQFKMNVNIMHKFNGLQVRKNDGASTLTLILYDICICEHDDTPVLKTQHKESIYPAAHGEQLNHYHFVGNFVGFLYNIILLMKMTQATTSHKNGANAASCRHNRECVACHCNGIQSVRALCVRVNASCHVGAPDDEDDDNN